MHQLAGEQFGKYRLLRRLAFGGMAEISLASLRRDAGFEKKVVLKRILQQLGEDPTFVQMFIDEAVLAARLTHPNIVQVYDFGDVESVYFLAMEYVDGADLRCMLRELGERGRAFGFAEVAAIGEGVAKGLSYAHNLLDDNGAALNIVHRDVSPHNIMLGRAGAPKLMDFGIAKAEARASRTNTGTIKGKVAYMAPEQAAGDPVDKRSDQFALGVVLWECLTGHRLFQGGSDFEVLRKVIDCAIPSLAETRSDVPEALAAVVTRMLQAQPQERYPDLRDAERELAGFRFSLGPAGAVQLGTLVDDVARNQGGRQAPGRRTMPLRCPESFSLCVEQPETNDGNTTAPTSPVPQLHLADNGAFAGEPVAEPAYLPAAGAASGPSPGSNGRKYGGVLASGVFAIGLVAAAVIFAGQIPELFGSRVGQQPNKEVNKTTRLQIVSQPAGASIWLYGSDVGLKTPSTIPMHNLGESLLVQLHKPGFEVWEQTVVLLGPEQLIKATLTELPKAVKPPPPTPRVVADTTGLKQAPEESGKAKSKKRREPQPPRDFDPKPEPKPVKTGKLTVRSSGSWVYVFVGDKSLGHTPVKGVDLPAGLTRLRLVNSAAGIDQSIEVDIPVNGHLKRIVKPR